MSAVAASAWAASAGGSAVAGLRGGESGSVERIEARSPSALPPFVAGASFEPNLGQADATVRWIGRGRTTRVYLTDTGTIFHSANGDGVRMTIEGVPERGTFGAGPRTTESSNHFHGRSRGSRALVMPRHRSVAWRAERGGAEVEWRGEAGEVAYGIRVEPGADPTAVALAFDGAEGMELSGDGSLLLATRNGVLRHTPPRAWQEGPGGVRRPIAVAFEVRGSRRAGFRVDRERLDPGLPLVIDPRLEFSSYLGGNDVEEVQSVARGEDGSAYLAGVTRSANFPVSETTFESAKSAERDFFVTRVSDRGVLLYSTYLGGNGEDTEARIAVDAEGAVHLAGNTYATDFPVVNPHQSASAGSLELVVAKLAASGTELDFSTYLGGAGFDGIGGIALGADGSVVVAGRTYSSDFPTRDPLQASLSGTMDGAVARFSSSGALVFSTYLGGSGFDGFTGVAVDGDGVIHLAGFTTSSDAPLQDPLQAEIGGTGTNDGYYGRMSSDGQSLVFGTFWGGTQHDLGTAVAVDADGAGFLGGYTDSSDFPTTAGA